MPVSAGGGAEKLLPFVQCFRRLKRCRTARWCDNEECLTLPLFIPSIPQAMCPAESTPLFGASLNLRHLTFTTRCSVPRVIPWRGRPANSRRSCWASARSNIGPPGYDGCQSAAGLPAAHHTLLVRHASGTRIRVIGALQHIGFSPHLTEFIVLRRSSPQERLAASAHVGHSLCQ